MSEQVESGDRGAAPLNSALPSAALSGAALLVLATERLLAECPTELPEQVALDRLRTIITCDERLQAARLAAVRDVDRRELWTLDAAGSTRGWLRSQLGGEDGQLMSARRLAHRPLVEAALAAGEISSRAAGQLCAVLDKAPDQVHEALLTGVLLDGVGGMLQTYTGGLVLDDALTPALLTARAEVDRLLQACVADRTASPAARLEPALVLLARRIAPGQLGPALRQLIEAPLPDGSDGLDADPYFFELRELLDGDVDVRGHLDPETGQALTAEVARRVALLTTAEKASAGETAESADPALADPALADAAPADAEHVGDEPAEDEPADVQPAEDEPAEMQPTDADPAGNSWDLAPGPLGTLGNPRLTCSAGRRRHDALAQLLHDLADTEPGSGQPAPASLTIIASLAAIEGRLGSLPGMLTSTGQPASVGTAALQRLGCFSELNAVLLDAVGNPVGASHTRRNATRRERRALRAQWGPTCAVDGCTNTATVPHHVDPWWHSKRTRLRDLVPACTHCHHDLHEGHRTLRLRDGRSSTRTAGSAPQPDRRSAGRAGPRKRERIGISLRRACRTVAAASPRTPHAVLPAAGRARPAPRARSRR